MSDRSEMQQVAEKASDRVGIVIDFLGFIIVIELLRLVIDTYYFLERFI